MRVVKCPRCEINFIREEEKFCPICLREMKGESTHDEVDMCIQCGEYPTAPGEDLCTFCIKERDLADKIASSLSDDSTDTAVNDDMEIPIQPEDIPGEELEKIHKELGLDDVFESEEALAEEDEEEEY